jgi:hypothetical protein
MAVNLVKGQILSSILERDGIDISIANANVGINTNSPTVRLEVVGNVIVGNLSTAGNVATGNLLTNNLLYANGTPWDLQQPAGNNTEIQFNNNSQFGANVNFTFDTTANLLTVNATANIANLNVAGNTSVGGNITGGNLLTNGNVSATGNVTGNYFFGTFVGNISGNLTVPGSSTQVIYNYNGNAAASPGFTFDQSSNAVVVTGNLTGGNVNTVGNVTAGNVLVGNIIIPAVGNISAGNVNINNLADPVANQDAATKYYVDQSISNIAVTNQTLYGNSVATAFTLNRSTTTAAALIMLNGITQVPDQSYAMVPNPSANLVFSEAPETGDVIDIRFL